MPRKELYRELKIREKELLEELAAIQKIIGGIRVSSSDNTQKANSMSSGGKGDLTWEEYWLKIAEGIKGEFKAKDAADIAVRENPNLDENTIRTSAKTKLSKLAGKGKIKSRRSKNLKAGNTYWN